MARRRQPNSIAKLEMILFCGMLEEKVMAKKPTAEKEAEDQKAFLEDHRRITKKLVGSC